MTAFPTQIASSVCVPACWAGLVGLRPSDYGSGLVGLCRGIPPEMNRWSAEMVSNDLSNRTPINEIMLVGMLSRIIIVINDSTSDTSFCHLQLINNVTITDSVVHFWLERLIPNFETLSKTMNAYSKTSQREHRTAHAEP